MEMNVEENKENFKATISSKTYDREKTNGECVIFQILMWHVNE
jgi:hypothetical protein